eukprot:g337.t1
MRYGDLFNDAWGRSYTHYMEMHMVPTGLDVVSDEAVIKVALRSPEVQAVMKKYTNRLMKTFLMFSNVEGEVDLNSYVKMVDAAGLIDADLTRLEGRRSFVRSQIAAHIELNEAGYDMGGVPSEDDASDRTMDFNEFMASLPRLGADKWDNGADGDLPIYIKQERISEALARLGDQEKRRGRRGGRRLV